MNKTILLLIFLLLFNFRSISLYSKTKTQIEPQSKSIKKIINKEKNKKIKTEIIKIIKNIDNIYFDLYLKLKENKKLIVFIDPAHGKLPDGRWQGGSATKRLSCTDTPEEYYSMDLSREIYKLLVKNKNIIIKTTDDYLEVLKYKSNTYKNIPFSKTVKLAKKHGAFIIISEHLNNVSMFHKAGGKVNLPGLHITQTRYGRKILRFINKTYKGFITLYNKLDSSNFSKNYALKIKQKLIEIGMTPNHWQKGAVADDRFSYFVDFPISIIYETGFISNPIEEKKLRDIHHIKKIVRAQYEALVENIKEIFGVDISGDIPKKVKKTDPRVIDLIKLSRIAVYYLKKGDTKKSISTIRTMQKYYKRTEYRNNIKYYTIIAKTLKKAERYYSLGKKYKRFGKYNRRKKRYKKSRRYYRMSRRYFFKARSLSSKPVFLTFNKKYSKELFKKRSRKKAYRFKRNVISRKRISNYIVKKSRRSKPIILTIEKNQNLEEALISALSPEPSVLKKLKKSFRNARLVKFIKKRRYSKKRKRYITYWRKIKYRVKFKKGIYIVKLNKKLKVIKAKRVKQVYLNSKKYQNHQYLSNSYFSNIKKIKAL